MSVNTHRVPLSLLPWVGALVAVLSMTVCAGDAESIDSRAAQIGVERAMTPPIAPYSGGSSQQPWQRSLDDVFANARTVRIELQIEANSPGPWSIRVVEGERVALSITPDSVAAEEGLPQSFWSDEIHLERAPRLVVTGSRAGLQFAVPNVIEIIPGLTPHVFVDGDQRKALATISDPRILTWAQAIGSLRFIRKSARANRRGYFGCTASLVGPRLLLTAAHCTADSDERLVSVEFEFFSEARASAANKVVRVSTARRDILPGRGLDYAFLRLAADQTLVASLKVAQSPMLKDGPLLLIQDSIEGDSGGLPAKQISEDGCLCTVPSIGPNFAHACDVINTGSGAPLLRADGAIVGIHVGGMSVGRKSENYGLTVRTIVTDMIQTSFGSDIQRELTFAP